MRAQYRFLDSKLHGNGFYESSGTGRMTEHTMDCLRGEEVYIIVLEVPDEICISRIDPHKYDGIPFPFFDGGKEEFIRRREALNRLIHEAFYHPQSETYGTGSQLDMVYPLLVGAVPQNLQAKVHQKLVEGWDHLGVGLVGVPVLTEWATLNHEADYMFRMLKQPDYPGYLFMINQGASGTWEDWQDPRSYFHNCYNGIGSWFYQALGGIIPTQPGYKTVRIDPQHPQGLQWVRVTRRTPYGTIVVSWEQENGIYKLHLEIPNGITATIGHRVLGAGKYDL